MFLCLRTFVRDFWHTLYLPNSFLFKSKRKRKFGPDAYNGRDSVPHEKPEPDQELEPVKYSEKYGVCYVEKLQQSSWSSRRRPLMHVVDLTEHTKTPKSIGKEMRKLGTVFYQMRTNRKETHHKTSKRSSGSGSGAT